jgi:hypothetical protein
MPSNLLRGATHRHMRPQEAAHAVVDRALLQLLRLLPRVHRDFGVPRQRGDIDRGLQRMPGTSSGSTSIGVRQFSMKSRDTLYRKSGCAAYRLCRYFSIVSIDTSGRRLMKSGTRFSLLCRYMTSDFPVDGRRSGKIQR